MRSTTGGHARPDVQRARARHLIALYEHDRNRGGGKRPGLGTVVSAVQGGLEGMGLSGAAHPVRRLHHPGGLMMLPTLGGRGGPLVRGLPAEAPEGKAARVGRVGRMGAKIDERQRLVNARRQNPVGRWQRMKYYEPADVNMQALPYLGLLGYVGYDAFKPKGPKHRYPDLPDLKKAHADPGWKRAHAEYQSVLDHLVRTDRISLPQSMRADGWAGRQSAPVLRARSNELRHKYRLPSK